MSLPDPLEMIRQAADEAEPPPPDESGAATMDDDEKARFNRVWNRGRILSALDLLTTDYPDPVWAVPGMIPEGLTVLAGKPKIGKSWLLMALAVAIAAGGRAFGSLPVEQGPVLYIGMEDSQRRLQDRLGKVLAGSAAPADLYMVDSWRHLDQGGTDDLDRAVGEYGLRAVILDTYVKVKPRSGGRNMYDEDSDAASHLQELGQRSGVAVIASHHLNQTNNEDWTERFSGSSGLIGVADTLAGIFRDRGEPDAVLRLVGRDIEEVDLALRFDPQTFGWSILGDAAEYQMSEARRRILQELREAGRPMTPSEVADLTEPELKYEMVKRTLARMFKAGEVESVPGGRYLPPTPVPPVPRVPTDPQSGTPGTSGTGVLEGIGE